MRMKTQYLLMHVHRRRVPATLERQQMAGILRMQCLSAARWLDREYSESASREEKLILSGR